MNLDLTLIYDDIWILIRNRTYSSIDKATNDFISSSVSGIVSEQVFIFTWDLVRTPIRNEFNLGNTKQMKRYKVEVRFFLKAHDDAEVFELAEDMFNEALSEQDEKLVDVRVIEEDIDFVDPDDEDEDE